MHQPQHDEACLHLNDEDYLPIDEFDSTSDSDADSLFDSSDNKADTASDTDLESALEDVNNNTDDHEDDLFDGEVRHPPEHYLAASANLDVGRLRQKRYSPKTQGRLDWVKDYHDRYKPNVDRLYTENSPDVALLLDTAPLLDNTPSSAFKKS
jgi:hypothetical protein